MTFSAFILAVWLSVVAGGATPFDVIGGNPTGKSVSPPPAAHDVIGGNPTVTGHP